MNKKEIKLIYFGLIWTILIQLLLVYNLLQVSKAIKGLNHNAHSHILLFTDIKEVEKPNVANGITRWYTTPLSTIK